MASVDPRKEAVDTEGKRLRELLVRSIVRSGCACAPDLAGQIGEGKSAEDLIPVLNSLVAEGILRVKKNDPGDTRKYNEFQTRYEVAR